MNNILAYAVLAGALGAAACTQPAPAKPPPPPPPAPTLNLSGGQLDIEGDIEFEKDSTVIRDTDKSRAVLNEFLKIMKDHPSIGKVRVEGHTDADGTTEHNLTLSMGRAASVEKWLVDHGIDDARLDPVGCGSRDPIVPNTTTENKARNRRTEFDVEKMDGKAPDGLVPACEANPHRK